MNRPPGYPTLFPPDAVDRIVQALQNPAWDWRTLVGLAQEAMLPQSQAVSVLHALGSVIEHGRTSAGEAVYRLRREPPNDNQLLWAYLTKRSSTSST